MEILLVILFSIIWYVPVYRKQGQDKLKLRYVIIAVVMGMIPVFVVSVLLLQIPLSWLFKAIGVSGTAKLACEAFVSAGITEEVVKWLGALAVLKMAKPQRKIDYILIFGAVGMGFHLVEGFASAGNMLTAALSGVLAYHIFWQFWMGMFYYEYTAAKASAKPAGKYLVLAFAVPIIVHGINDFIAFMVTGSVGELVSFSEGWATAYLGWFVVMVVFTIFMYKAVLRAARESRESAELKADPQTLGQDSNE